MLIHLFIQIKARITKSGSKLVKPYEHNPRLHSALQLQFSAYAYLYLISYLYIYDSISNNRRIHLMNCWACSALGSRNRLVMACPIGLPGSSCQASQVCKWALMVCRSIKRRSCWMTFWRELSHRLP